MSMPTNVLVVIGVGGDGGVGVVVYCQFLANPNNLVLL